MPCSGRCIDEPTLFKAALLDMLETVLTVRTDLRFHILSNGQHFEPADIERLRHPLYRQVQWGIPLYATDPALHDAIVAKPGAWMRLEESFTYLLRAGANIELRTVVMSSNASALPALARHIASRLTFIEGWSIMQLENIIAAIRRIAAIVRAQAGVIILRRSMKHLRRFTHHRFAHLPIRHPAQPIRPQRRRPFIHLARPSRSADGRSCSPRSSVECSSVYRLTAITREPLTVS